MEVLATFCIIGGIILFLLMEHPIIFWSIVIFVVLIIILAVVKSQKITGTKDNDSDNDVHYFDDTETTAPRQHLGKCDGNCDACPPHYGYRYGRWYYGHSHVHGCEFGGNKGDGGRD